MAASGILTFAVDEYLAANRDLWNEWVGINSRSALYDVEGFKAGRCTIPAWQRDEVGDVSGKSLLHLQCHFGLDTLSWARLGARVTGVDFSARGLELARALAAELGIEATFVLSEVLELPQVLEGEFDIVFTSIGVLGWLPDMTRWAAVVAHFLRPGGVFYIAELHPFALVFDESQEATELRLRYPYFPRPEPIALPVQGSYADRRAQVEQRVEYDWIHSMAEIVTSILSAGLRIEFLHEFPFGIEPQFPFLDRREDGRWYLPERQAGEIPLLFSIRARKPAE